MPPWRSARSAIEIFVWSRLAIWLAALIALLTLEPMRKFPMVRDLAVDRSRMFESLKQVKAWIELDGTHTLGPGPRQSQRRVWRWNPLRPNASTPRAERGASRRRLLTPEVRVSAPEPRAVALPRTRAPSGAPLTAAFRVVPPE